MGFGPNCPSLYFGSQKHRKRIAKSSFWLKILGALSITRRQDSSSLRIETMSVRIRHAELSEDRAPKNSKDDMGFCDQEVSHSR